MITALVAFAAFAQGQARPKPADLVSKMMDHYSQASTLSGKLSYVQTAAGYTAKGETIVQFERPNKLYVFQTFSGTDSPKARIVSDGKRFLYSVPQAARTQSLGVEVPYQELAENVQQGNQVLNLGDIYNIGGSGLIIKPAPLDIAIGRLADLKMLRSQIVSVDDQGDDTVNGQAAHLVGGDWREYDAAPPSAKYQMAITDAGDLLRYSMTEKVADPSGKMAPIDVVTTWTVDLKVNGQVDQSLFKDKDLNSSGKG